MRRTASTAALNMYFLHGTLHNPNGASNKDGDVICLKATISDIIYDVLAVQNERTLCSETLS